MAEIEFDSEKIKRFFKGEHSGEDASYIDELFCDNSKEKELKSHLSKQFDSLVPEDDIDNENLDHILYRIHYHINTTLGDQKVSSFDKIVKWSLRIAGVLILPLLIFIGIRTFKETNINKDTWVEIKAPAWTRAQFSLPDGTTGWLNSNSSVKYKGNFNADRNVTLTGEAFFDVYKDKKRPFKVNTNEVIITVLGTRFNVASYENEKNIEVVLEEGKLICTDKNMDKSYIMKPNDLIVYDKTLKGFSTKEVEPQKYVSWTEGKLVFRNDQLDVIARRLERWYNVEVEINGNIREDLSLRATFIGEGLEEVLGLLKHSLPIDFKIEYGVLKQDETYSKTKVIILPRTK